MKISSGQIYEHYKGNQYEIISCAIHTETDEEMIVCRALYDSVEYGDKCTWVRPRVMFEGSVEVDGMRVPRFKYIKTD